MNEYSNWNIEQGDYQRKFEDTNEYYQQLKKKKFIQEIIRTSVYLLTISFISYLIIKSFQF